MRAGMSDAARQHLTWVDGVAKNAHQRPTAPAIRYNGQTTTWAGLDDRSRRLAAALRDRGVGAGDRVLLLITNRPEFLEAVVATNRIGAVCVPVNFRLIATDVAYLAQDSASCAVIIEQHLASLLAGIPDRVQQRCLVIGDDAESAGACAELYEDAIGAATPDQGDGPADLSATAMIMYTSGTTGRPKGAMLTYENYLAMTITVVETFRLGEDEIHLVTQPLFHVGAVGSALPALIFGHTIVIMPSGTFCAAGYLELAEAERVTRSVMVPTMWQAVCDSNAVARHDLRLRSVCWGAAPATLTLLHAMAREFPDTPIVCTFGQTETTALSLILSDRDAHRKIGSVGKPISTIWVRVVDTDNNDVRPGEIGEIVYRGPQVMTGYWNNSAATAEVFDGGWMHSGDLVRVDEEGYYYIVDRAKDMIISGGENIYSSEVENAVAEHPKVREVAVVGMPHDKWGETPVAIVTAVDPTNPPQQDDVIAFCADRLASYRKPTRVLVVDELPRNAAGKVTKQKLRELTRSESVPL